MTDKKVLSCPKSILCLRVLFAVVTISVAVFIFVMSSQNAHISSKTSGDVIVKIVSAIDNTYKTKSPEEQRQIVLSLQKIVRKLAHFCIFGALGVFSASFMATFNKPFKLKFLFPQLFCSIYAVSDEIHQNFVVGRSCEFRDMLIDSCGSFCGIILVLLIVYLCVKRKEVKFNAKKRTYPSK